MTIVTHKKLFESFPVRAIRMSDKTWEILKSRKQRSGESWNKFVLKLLDKKRICK